MKIASIITFLALLLIPTIIWVTLILQEHFVYKDDTKKSPLSRELSGKTKRKWLIVVAGYAILFFSAIAWMFYELTWEYFNFNSFTYIVIFGSFLIFIGTIVWGITPTIKNQMSVPRPPPDAPISEQLKYENAIADLMDTNYLKRGLKFIFAGTGIIVVFIFLVAWIYGRL